MTFSSGQDMNDIDRLVWRKSTRSNGGSECVEVALGERRVGVRDSKDRSGPALWLPAPAWTDFLAGVRAGAFDFDPT